ISPVDNDDSRNKFSSLNTSNLINQNSEIQISLSNLKFFSDMRINNLAQLRSSIISYIVNSDRKLTIDEFEQYLTDNTKKAEIIQTIADNISIFANNTRSISVDKIKNINLVVSPENNQTRDLQIELDSDFVKYQLSESTNAGTLKDNILTVKNLEFYNAINIPTDKLNKLQNNIQNYINSPENKLLLDDFIKATNTEAFKKEVAHYLGVNDTRLISSISYNNDLLTITPLVDSVNNNRNKFTTPTASNLIDNGNIIVSGFNFFNLIQLTNTDNLTSIINSINLNENNKFTPIDFRNYISDAQKLSDLKNTIANNIQTGWNQTLDVNKIENIQLNDSNQLVISLDSDFVKYSISRNSSVIGTPNSNLNQENSQLIINNLQFYTQINISDNDLINIKTKINEYIENNNIASGNNISSEQLKQFMQNIKVTILSDNTQSDLLSLISSVSFVNNSVQIIFNNLIKINDKEIQNQSISISNNTITISNFDFKPSRDFYTWSGNTITGLTDLGKQQTDIILPAETTGILNNVFTNNTKIVSVDMSNTQITKIPLGLGNVGLFMNCTSLKSVILPNNLTSIGAQAFKNCSLLNSINLPNALEDIGMGAFYKTNLSNI
ncbi:MAG: leucine-rich repeat protein, partial [Ureaplasma sp.]|nr:leucine-rich repeat protein [Ureaplasma sp.]